MSEATRAGTIPRAVLPDHCDVGNGVVVHAHDLRVEPGVRIGDGVHLVGETVHLGRDVRIGADSDLRAGTISIGAGSEIAGGVRVLCADSFRVGDAARVCAGVDVVARSFDAGRLLYLGPHTVVGYGGTLESTAVVRIGDRVSIGPHNILNANCEITLGSDVGSGGYVSLWTHGYHFAHSVLDGYHTAFTPVSIGDRVWLGYHCSVMPGADIGEECIVASGAVVTRSFPARRLLAGVPAKEKTTFDQPVLSDEQALDAVREALRSWHRELRWKGVQADLVDDGVVVQHAGRARFVELRGDAAEVATAGPDERGDRIVVAVDGKPDPEPGDTPFFVVRRRLFSGPTDELVEDLRDHLRRRTMPCGDERTFSSIVPAAFRALTAATEGVHA
ncbi:acetyltransferase-like isoleucine patch superfamily enzyme [Saccharothrix ecbatanensis]|uniref:Acetyltransferase-like isoleucine patch superfamily enzyme n=1 Tax=Saccharothrix ecbatanensis TaxID=1105145 RepID=A0A7W9HDH0_9PSEU|nr:DapH/DapD/GlmU-related protein [Saccharothrix ecbatanensis]MBB5800269.1 acetyltransferase-like isoleucine patch superfamily enzyme [Saccharothrix ecbatanensis]